MIINIENFLTKSVCTNFVTHKFWSAPMWGQIVYASQKWCFLFISDLLLPHESNRQFVIICDVRLTIRCDIP